MRATQALAPLLVALLLAPAPAAAQGDAEDAEAAALAPLEVALRDLPDIIRLALNESERRLISDQAQARLAQQLEYVRGFSDLPPGGGALREADVRDAYSWLQAVVETIAGIPSTFDDSQNAGATCRAAFAGVPANDPQATVKLGLDGVDRLGILRAELEALLDAAPSILDVGPLREAVALIEGYWVDVAPEIVDCLERLEDEAGSVPRVPLKAVVLPATSFPTGHVRVLGTAPAGSSIKVASSSLSVSAAPALLKGAFKQPITVPRAATLGNHTITVTAADLRVDVTLNVAKAPIQLSLFAPERVTADLPFTATVTVSSPASFGEVDRVAVRLSWRSQDRSLPLANGSSSSRLDAGSVGDFVLRADYPGSNILAADSAERIVHVAIFVPSGELDANERALGIPAGFNGLSGTSVIDWFWWILILILAIGFGLALYMSPVALHRLRGPSSNVIRGSRPPPRWPGAATLAGAMGALFDLLRRLQLVPAGRTVQEWIHKTKGPTAIADTFDAVRYGGAVESEETKAQGVTWAKAAWDRWAKR